MRGERFTAVIMYSDEAGFTLVELLGAMVAAALLLTALGSINAGLSSMAARQERGESRTSDRAGSLFTAMIQRAQPPLEGQTLELSSHHLRFPVQPPEALPEVTDMLADLRIARRGGALTFIAELINAETGLSLPNSRITVPSNARDLWFEAEQSNEADGRSRLIRVALVSTKANGARETRMAAPRLSGARDCRFDPISLRCRP